ncbi:MAG: glycosyltransferase family 2 protein [Candidatus Omnitrophota bacterium]
MIESLSVVFPMFNERECVGKTVSATLAVLKDVTQDYEIIIVDDASTDGSAAIVEGLARENSHIKVIHHASNRTLGGALKTGFAASTKAYVLYSDVDMPFDFKEIKKAVQVLLGESADVVSAFRLNRGVDGFTRTVYSAAYNIMVKALFGLKIRDVNFSFKLIKREALKTLDLTSEGSFINAELFVRFSLNNAKIVQFGTYYLPRRQGISKLSSLPVIVKILQEMLLFKCRLQRGLKES